MSRFDGYTGHLFEEEVLGYCLAICRGYVTWRDALELVRKNQPRAKTPVAVSLEREISRQLGAAVHFFTAVRSPLDVYHGVDGLFEFHGVMVTIDLTMNSHKDSGKADLIVEASEIDNLALLAGRIVREMRSRLARRA